MTTQICEGDLAHMHQFSASTKVQVMEKILSATPADRDANTGEGSYQRMLRKLRSDGFALIDLQAMETAFRTVWYCKSKSLFGLRESESVAMLVWESADNVDYGGATTVMKWRL
jgi:hypothetical protein